MSATLLSEGCRLQHAVNIQGQPRDWEGSTRHLPVRGLDEVVQEISHTAMILKSTMRAKSSPAFLPSTVPGPPQL